ncbi:RNA pyrophosphohydrolase [compost metagenome]
MKHSAALVLMRRTSSGPECLLGHPGGPFWRRRDDGAWTVPKGLIRPGESPLAAAFREFREETGFEPVGRALPLPPTPVDPNKTILPFAMYGDLDPAAAVSNLLHIEWPRSTGRFWRFPELDRVAWFSPADADRKIISHQKPLLAAAWRAERRALLFPPEARLKSAATDQPDCP